MFLGKNDASCKTENADVKNLKMFIDKSAQNLKFFDRNQHFCQKSQNVFGRKCPKSQIVFKVDGKQECRLFTSSEPITSTYTP